MTQSDQANLGHRLYGAYLRLARRSQERAARQRKLRMLREIERLPHEIRKDLGFQDF